MKQRTILLSIILLLPSISRSQDLYDVHNVQHERINCAILMPMTSGDKSSANNLEFYAGALLAAKDAGEEGIDANILAYDFSNDSGWRMLAMVSNSFIIGPVKSEDIAEVRQYIPNGTTLVSPLDTKASYLARNHSNIFQAAPSQTDQYRDMVEWAEEEMLGNNAKYIIVGCKSDTVALNTAKWALQQKGIRYSVCMADVQGEISGWQSQKLPKGSGTNVAILAINNEAVLNNAVRDMSIHVKDGNTIVFAGSKVRSYETISTERLHKAELHVVCPYYIDYKDERTMAFVHSYRALFNAEPSRHAFQGYDLMYYMLNTHHKYGKNWPYYVRDTDTAHLLQTSFKLRRIPEGGLVNTAMRRIVYKNDFSIKLVK